MFAFACCDSLYFVTYPFEDMAEVPSSIYQANKRIQNPFEPQPQQIEKTNTPQLIKNL